MSEVAKGDKTSKQKSIPHQDITYEMIGAAMRVHNRLGPGHKEAVYQRDLTAEMRASGLKVREEYPFAIYREDGTFLGYLYVDHIVEDLVIAEVKALSHLVTKEEIAQVITYLAATAFPVGLLFNFGRRKLDFHRILRPTRLEGWENRLIRYLWQPDDPVAAAKAFAVRGIEPGQIIVPSSDIIYPSRPPSTRIPPAPTVEPTSVKSAHPLSVNLLGQRQSADSPSVNLLGQRQSVDSPSADSDSAILDELFTVIQDRKVNMPAGSYTVRLFEKGPAEIAKKVGEEVIEVIVASAQSDREQLVYESADLIYHLLVLLAEHDISVEELYEELIKRRK
ncbi:MAG: phosphoribosyl-ATP diphosphatase [Anaerolineae bacterium]